MPLVSIIMPVYNTGNVLHSQNKSVLMQTFTDFELLLIDDGSQDGSSEICDYYAQKDPRVLVFHKINGGICDARNYGITRTCGKYIAFCDHDDEYLPFLLEKSIEIFEKTDSDLLHYRYRNYSDLQKDCIFELPILNKDIWNITNLSILHNKLEYLHYFSTVWSIIYKADLIKSNKIRFNTKLKHGGEDLEFNLMVMKYASRMIVIPDILYIHRIRESLSTSAKYYEDLLFYYHISQKLDNDIITQKGINCKDEYYTLNLTHRLISFISLASIVGKQYKEIRYGFVIFEDLDLSTTIVKKYNWINPRITLIYILFKFKLYLLLYILFKYRNRKRRKKHKRYNS